MDQGTGCGGGRGIFGYCASCSACYHRCIISTGNGNCDIFGGTILCRYCNSIRGTLTVAQGIYSCIGIIQGVCPFACCCYWVCAVSSSYIGNRSKGVIGIVAIDICVSCGSRYRCRAFCNSITCCGNNSGVIGTGNGHRHCLWCTVFGGDGKCVCGRGAGS